MKTCRKCGERKSAEEFRARWTICKECANEKQRARRDRARSKRKQLKHNRKRGNVALVKRGLKICNECGIVKTLNEFYRCEAGTGGVRAKCAMCHSKKYDRSKYVGSVVQRVASAAISCAIKHGEIERPSTCPICGKTPIVRNSPRIVFHHTNGYSKENRFVGVFVCAKCHMAIHRGEIEVVGRKWK